MPPAWNVTCAAAQTRLRRTRLGIGYVPALASHSSRKIAAGVFFYSVVGGAKR